MATKGIRNKKIEQTEAKTILNTVKSLDLNTVISEVSGLQVNVQNTLAGLSSALTSKIQELQNMDTAISLKESRLKELYGIEDAAITLDDMKAQREEEIHKGELARADRSRIWMEEESDRQKKWKRENDEYEYTKIVQQKKWKDEFETEVLMSKRNEATRQDMLNKSWTEREKGLKDKEQELVSLKETVNNFDARLKAEIVKAEAIVTNNLKQKYDHEVALLKKDYESFQKSEGIKNSAYELTIKSLEDRVKEMNVQLVSARQDAKEVASQALQSASGRQVAEALQRVVDNKEPNAKK